MADFAPGRRLGEATHKHGSRHARINFHLGAGGVVLVCLNHISFAGFVHKWRWYYIHLHACSSRFGPTYETVVCLSEIISCVLHKCAGKFSLAAFFVRVRIWQFCLLWSQIFVPCPEEANFFSLLPKLRTGHRGLVRGVSPALHHHLVLHVW